MGVCFQPISQSWPRTSARPLGGGLSHGHVPLRRADGAERTEGLLEVGLCEQQLVQPQNKVNDTICYTRHRKRELASPFDAACGQTGRCRPSGDGGIVRITTWCCCRPWLCVEELLAARWRSCQQCSCDVPAQLFGRHFYWGEAKREAKISVSFLLVSP